MLLKILYSLPASRSTSSRRYRTQRADGRIAFIRPRRSQMRTVCWQTWNICATSRLVKSAAVFSLLSIFYLICFTVNFCENIWQPEQPDSSFFAASHARLAHSRVTDEIPVKRTVTKPSVRAFFPAALYGWTYPYLGYDMLWMFDIICFLHVQFHARKK